MNYRYGVVAGQESIGGVWFCFLLQNLMQRAHAYHVTEFHMAEFLPGWHIVARPRKPICKRSVALVLCVHHPFQSIRLLHMVLKAPDYGFIGVKLKGLIFLGRETREHTGSEYSALWKEISHCN